jgi:hypothetical protein
MSIITALLMTAIILYCIGGCLIVKRVVKEEIDYIYDMPLLILLLPPCIIVAFIFWPFVLAWESIESTK